MSTPKLLIVAVAALVIAVNTWLVLDERCKESNMVLTKDVYGLRCTKGVA